MGEGGQPSFENRTESRENIVIGEDQNGVQGASDRTLFGKEYKYCG